MKKAERIALALLALTAAAAVLYGILGTVSILRAGPMTRFPWYAAWAFTALYFGPVLIAETVVCAVLHCCNKKRKEDVV